MEKLGHFLVDSQGVETEIEVTKFEISSSSKNKIFFTYNFEESFENSLIIIKMKDQTIFESSEVAGSILKINSVTVRNVNYLKSDQNASVQAVGAATSQATGIITILLFIISAPMAVALVKLFQLVDFLVYINVKIPTNARNFMELFQTNVFNFLPNFISINEEQLECEPHQKFVEEELTCTILNNAGSQIFQLSVVLIFKVVLYFLCKMFDKTKVNQID